MLKKYRQENALSYVIGIIFLIIIFSTIGASYSSIIEKHKARRYVSTSINDAFAVSISKVYDEDDIKNEMVEFYATNKGKYVKWKIKVDEVQGLFDVVRYNLKDDVKFTSYSELGVKCKFDDDIQNKIKNNQIIIVSGQVTGYSEFSKCIELQHCKMEN